jgi:hypothetical protein
MKKIEFNIPNKLYSNIEKKFPLYSRQLSKRISKFLEEEFLFEECKSSSLDKERELLSREWDSVDLNEWNKQTLNYDERNS